MQRLPLRELLRVRCLQPNFAIMAKHAYMISSSSSSIVPILRHTYALCVSQYWSAKNIMQDDSAPQNRHSLVKYKMGQSVRKFIPLPVIKRSKMPARRIARRTIKYECTAILISCSVVKLGGTLSVRLCACIIPSVRLVVKYQTRFKVVKLIWNSNDTRTRRV